MRRRTGAGDLGLLAILVMVFTAGCGGSGDPAETAMAFQAHRAAGDLIMMYPLLSPEDQAATTPTLQDVPRQTGIDPEGFVRVEVDTAFVIERSRDTARVATRLRVPNRAWIESRLERLDDVLLWSAAEETLIKDAPLVAALDTVVLARAGREWRVVLRIPEWQRIQAVFDSLPYLSYFDHPVNERAARAQARLEAVRAEGLIEYTPWLAKQAAEEADMLAYADSVDLADFRAVDPLAGSRSARTWVRLRGTLHNRGSRTVTVRYLHAVDGSGQNRQIYAGKMLAPGQRMDVEFLNDYFPIPLQSLAHQYLEFGVAVVPPRPG
jgi:hypothetical protein